MAPVALAAARAAARFLARGLLGGTGDADRVPFGRIRTPAEARSRIPWSGPVPPVRPDLCAREVNSMDEKRIEGPDRADEQPVTQEMGCGTAAEGDRQRRHPGFSRWTTQF